jgi:drug/metabolite transporter (DMT)-like permease
MDFSAMDVEVDAALLCSLFMMVIHFVYLMKGEYLDF